MRSGGSSEGEVTLKRCCIFLLSRCTNICFQGILQWQRVYQAKDTETESLQFKFVFLNAVEGFKISVLFLFNWKIITELFSIIFVRETEKGLLASFVNSTGKDLCWVETFSCLYFHSRTFTHLQFSTIVFTLFLVNLKRTWVERRSVIVTLCCWWTQFWTNQILWLNNSSTSYILHRNKQTVAVLLSKHQYISNSTN